MKDYNQKFTTKLEVQLVADKMLNVYQTLIGDVNDNASDIELEVYKKDLKYYTTVVESIMDNIADNEKACSDVFNALNGWVKTETPMDTMRGKKEITTTCQSDTTRHYREDTIVMFNLDVQDAQLHDLSTEWIVENQPAFGVVMEYQDNNTYKITAACINANLEVVNVYFFISPKNIIGTRDDDFYHGYRTVDLPLLAESYKPF